MENLKTLIKYELEKREFWKKAWVSVASATNCLSPEIPTNWANKALKDFNKIFEKNIESIIYIEQRDKEIKDLEYEINILKTILENKEKTIIDLQTDLFECKQHLNRENTL